MTKEEHQLRELVKKTLDDILSPPRPCTNDEPAVPVIAAAILSTRNGQHAHAAVDLQMVIGNIRPDLMARAHDHLFDVWLKSKTDEYLTHAWPTAAKRYQAMNNGIPLPYGHGVGAEVLMDNDNFSKDRDFWLERHCKTIRKLALNEKFNLAASGSLWVCENLFTGFLALGKEHKE